MKPADRHPIRTLTTGMVAAALALPLALVAQPAPAAQASATDLITDHVVQIEETISDAGFVHPGIGLSAEDLRTAQTQARAGVQPWASYFEAMTQVQPWANRDYDPDNMVDGQPDVVLTPNFDQGGLRGRMTRDAFGAMTQAVLWVVTGDEVYRRNAMWTLRTWSNMNPDGYAYFPDAHIHTGHPLYQFLLAAEIIRATAPVPDVDPGEYDGYDTVWHPEDDEKLLENLARPIMEVFNFSNERYMNQHNFGLFGRIATAIYADDAEGYQQGVEWLTVNAGYDGHDNGAIDPLFPVIAADDPVNDYGTEFVQIQEMGRDQAHAECDVDNFTGLARMVGVQGTRVDPEQGTVSTAEDAVSVYAFGDNRILHGANSFAGFMLGAEVPWVDTTGEGVQISQAYRGRLFNPLDELYLQYRYEAGVDVAAEAPWIAELHQRWDGPLGWYGTGESNFWAPGDKNPEYWLALPAELAGTTPPARAESPELRFAEHSLQLDTGTRLVTEDGRTFARAQASPDGTTSVVSRMMYGSSAVGVLLRSDGPATLEVLPTATEEPYVTVDVPDTEGQWRYVTYPPGGTNTHFYRVVGADGVTVDLDRVSLSAGEDLAPPQLEPVPERIYAAAGDELTVTLPLASEGEATFRAEGLPTGASIDAATGVITWQPSAADTGEHALQVVVDDGTSLDSARTTVVVTADREAMIEAAVADGTDPDATYTTRSAERLAAALVAAREQVDVPAEQFHEAFAALESAIGALELLNPQLVDGTLDFSAQVTASVISSGALAALVDQNSTSTTGDLRQRSFVLDFGPAYRVQAEAFGLQGRALFPNRSQGTNVYGSLDGTTWTRLTERPTAEVSGLETIDVVAEHRDEKFRYLKLQVDEPGIPTDPAYPGIWTIAELRVHGQRSEVPGVLTDVALSSPDSLAGRVTSGDTVELEVTARTPVDDLAVTIGGQQVAASSEDGLHWTASTTLPEGVEVGPLAFSVEHDLPGGQTAEPVVGTTDFSWLFVSEESDQVDLDGLTEVVDAAGEPDADAATQAGYLFDADAGTHTDVPVTGDEAALVWDLQQGGSLQVDRVELLLRQDNNGLTRLDDTYLEGSNDLDSWVQLTGSAAATHSWQSLASISAEGYRYLRLRNGGILGVAELRVFGDLSLDLDGLIDRAHDLDISDYSRAAQILFTREVDAVAAAAAEPEADRDALADRLLAAWDLLEVVPTEVAQLDPAWVTASGPSWDGTLDAAANGWAMFDGDPATFTDTATSSGTVTVLPEGQLSFDTLRVLPRASHPDRANGIQLQVSADAGQTWSTISTLEDVLGPGWIEIALDEPQQVNGFRVLAESGNTNLAEVELTRTPVDLSAIELYLTETADLEPGDWTPGSWDRLVAARDAARAVLDDPEADQETADAATADLAAAIDELHEADTTRPVVAVAVADGVVTVTASDEGLLDRMVANLYDEDNAKFLGPVGSTSASVPLAEAESVQTWRLPDGLAPGTYTVRVSASDLAGNIGVATTQVIIEDSTRPVVAVAVADGVVTVSASDEGLLDRMVANLYDEDNAQFLGPVGSTSASVPLAEAESVQTWRLPDGLASGTYTVRVSASDLAGNIGVATTQVIIEDSTRQCRPHPGDGDPRDCRPPRGGDGGHRDHRGDDDYDRGHRRGLSNS